MVKFRRGREVGNFTFPSGETRIERWKHKDVPLLANSQLPLLF